jgi:hypothetical protein
MNEDAADDKIVAEEGWGPTLRLSTLVLTRGLAHRIAATGQGTSRRRVVGVTSSVVGAAVGMYAKARGWV